MNEEKKDGLNCWALVELFGHQKIVGVASETTIAGGAFLRVDVPAVEGEKAFTRFYGHSAIYSISPITEEIGLALVKSCCAQPVKPYDLPRQLQAPEKESNPLPGSSCPDCFESMHHCRCLD